MQIHSIDSTSMAELAHIEVNGGWEEGEDEQVSSDEADVDRPSQMEPHRTLCDRWRSLSLVLYRCETEIPNFSKIDLVTVTVVVFVVVVSGGNLSNADTDLNRSTGPGRRRVDLGGLDGI